MSILVCRKVVAENNLHFGNQTQQARISISNVDILPEPHNYSSEKTELSYVWCTKA